MKKSLAGGVTDYILKPLFQLLSVNEFIAEGHVEIIEYSRERVLMNVFGVSEKLRVDIYGCELYISYYTKRCVGVCGVIKKIDFEKENR